MAFDLPLPDNLKSFVLKRKDILVIVGILLAGLIAAILIFKVQQERIKRSASMIKSEEERVAIGRDVSVLDKKISQMRGLYAKKVNSLNMKKIEGIALVNNLTVVSSSQDKEIDTGTYAVLPMKFIFEGRYHNLGAFLSTVESQPEMVNIKGVSIKGKEEAFGEPEGEKAAKNNIIVNAAMDVVFLK